MTQQFHFWLCMQKNRKVSKRCFVSIFIAALFKTAKTWKKPKCPVMDELHAMEIYTIEYYSVSNREENSDISYNVD